MPATVDFYFDVISPYAYIAEARLRAEVQWSGVTVVYRPVLFAGLLRHWGQLGPAEIPAKRVFTFKDVLRRCAEYNLPLQGPKFHPFNPLVAQRAILAAAPSDRVTATAAVLHAGWALGADLGDADAVATALTSAGLSGAALVARAAEPDIKAGLLAETEQAIARGVFGVPSFVVGDEVLWGQDRLRDLPALLEGRDPVPTGSIEALLARPAAAQRRR